MPIQGHVIHEMNYCLDHLVMFGTIGADVANYITMYMPECGPWYDVVSNSLDRRANLDETNDHFGSACNAQYIKAIQENIISEDEQAVCLLSYVDSFDYIFENEIVRGVANNFISNYNKGSSDDEILDECQNSNVYDMDHDHYNQFLMTLNRTIHNNSNIPRSSLMRAPEFRQEQFREFERNKRDIYQRLLVGDYDCVYSDELERNKFLAKNPSVLRRNYQKVVKKSVGMLQNFMGDDTTKAFLGGDSVVISGDHFDYSIKKNSYQRLGNNHGLKIEVLHKETKDYLFSICWYVEDTPVAEEILVFMMHVKAGNEEQILRVGNPYNINKQNVVKYGIDEKMKKIDTRKAVLYGIKESNQSVVMGDNGILEHVTDFFGMSFWETHNRINALCNPVMEIVREKILDSDDRIKMLLDMSKAKDYVEVDKVFLLN